MMEGKLATHIIHKLYVIQLFGWVILKGVALNKEFYGYFYNMRTQIR